MVDWRTLTWTCMVCKDERPDRFISVAHRHLRGMEGRFPETRVNVRFCNDRVECIEKATRTGVWPEEGS
jgi:hypothetical protein